MIFRQLFEPHSSTYTYLIACEATKKAILVDPVYPTWERDLNLIRELGLELAYTVETHVHADHITSALKLRQESGSRIAFPKESAAECPDLVVNHHQAFPFGDLALMPLYTPGHTDDHYAYLIADRVLTGDALLIDGCGRTDFQNGDPADLYESLHNILLTLPDDTLVYPGHDYKGWTVSTIGEEKRTNPRLEPPTKDAFIELMDNLDLPDPKMMDVAVPANRACGMPDEAAGGAA